MKPIKRTKKPRVFSKDENQFIVDYKKHLNFEQKIKEDKFDRFCQKHLLSLGIDTNYRLERFQRRSFIQDKFNFLNSEFTEKGLVPIFFTATLPSEFHAFPRNDVFIGSGSLDNDFRFVGSEISFNKFSHQIRLGAEKLQQLHRNIYKDFRINRKYQKDTIKFIKVIEPHKSLLPHMHCIYYCPPEYLTQFKRHIFNQIKLLGFNKKGCDLKDLDNKGAIYYLLKYINKELLGYSGLSESTTAWYSFHDIKQYVTSNSILNKALWNASHYLIDYAKDSFYTGFKKLTVKLVESLENVVFNPLEKVIYKVNRYYERVKNQIDHFGYDYFESPFFDNPFDDEIVFERKKVSNSYMVNYLVNVPSYHSRPPIPVKIEKENKEYKSDWDEYIFDVREGIKAGEQRMLDYWESIPF